MKKTLIFSFLAIPFCLYGQVSGVIVDSQTKKPIPFANIWVENLDIGTTSTESGLFQFADTLLNKNLVVSSVGYETQHYKITSHEVKVLLVSKVYELSEVIITYPLGTKTQELGKFKKSKILSFYNSGGKPWIAARYFEYDDNYNKTPFIKSVEILTSSEREFATIRFRLMAVGKKGEPNDDLIQEQLILNVPKGENQIMTIDLTKYQLKFPKEGFFVAMEWLDTPNNEFEYEHTDKKSGAKSTKKRYIPSVGNIIEADCTNGWIYIYGAWQKPVQIKVHYKDFFDKYRNIAAKVTLSN